MRILISGSGGFIGSRLVARLLAAGHEVIRMVRSQPAGEGALFWNPDSGKIDPSILSGADAVVNLAGENVAAGRWTDARKNAIRGSRVNTTRVLAEAMALIGDPPRVLINASAVGIYGNRGNEPLDESSPPGAGFLADVCREWEAATDPAEDAGVRVVRTRFGVVLDPSGGALAQMLPFFKAGLGGPIGGGHQYISWITLDDAVAAIEFALKTEELGESINVVAPNPVTQAEFATELGRAVKRPAVVPTPAFVLRMKFGQMADETILSSARVFPQVLLKSGFEFTSPDLETAFEMMFK